MPPATTFLDSVRAIGRRLGSDPIGAVSAEYVIVVGTVGLMAVSAFVVIGPELVAAYDHARNVLAVPFP